MEKNISSQVWKIARYFQEGKQLFFFCLLTSIKNKQTENILVHKEHLLGINLELPFREPETNPVYLLGFQEIIMTL